PHSPHFSSNTHVHHTYLHPFPTRRSSDLHHGANQPVKDLSSGKVAITAQNHGFAVDPKSLPSDVEVTHINLNDGTVEGMRYKEQIGRAHVLNSSHRTISYAVFCLKKKKKK